MPTPMPTDSELSAQDDVWNGKPSPFDQTPSKPDMSIDRIKANTSGTAFSKAAPGEWKLDTAALSTPSTFLLASISKDSRHLAICSLTARAGETALTTPSGEDPAQIPIHRK